MPLNVNGAKKATEKSIPINKIGPGEVFHFTSKTDPKNTGNYIRVASKTGKGLHLGTFKSIKFGSGETGVLKTASMTID
jgi:hypothetical protein